MGSREEEEWTVGGERRWATSGSVVVVVGDAAATGEAGGNTEASSSGATSCGNVPHTPTMEDLLKVAEEGASGGREAAAESVAVTAGHFTATPVLRTSVVEPRGGDCGIGASQPVPLEEGDFLESADPRDILDAPGVDPSAADVLKGADSPDAMAAATPLGLY